VSAELLIVAIGTASSLVIGVVGLVLQFRRPRERVVFIPEPPKRTTLG
jgi:hypothetical protein